MPDLPALRLEHRVYTDDYEFGTIIKIEPYRDSWHYLVRLDDDGELMFLEDQLHPLSLRFDPARPEEDADAD